MSGAVAMGVVLAVVTACSGSSSPGNTAGGPVSGTPGATPSASGSTLPSTAASASPGATPGATGTPAAGHTVSTGPGSKPPGRPTGFTQAGTYDYDIDGTATTRLGTQKLNSTDTLKVDPPKGSLQKSTQESQQGHRDTTLASKSGGLFVVDINIQQSSFKEDFKPVGTALYFPGDYHVGSAWHWVARSTDGKYRLDVTSKISASTNITIHGKTMPTVVIDSVMRFTGNSLDLTDNQRDWVSTAYALIVKEHLDTHGTIAGFKYSSQETRTIRSTTPTSS
ncbi:MAG: hypothetical protein QOC82_2567 [Frankiaceae bacterium]|nr:hypothetical protein [Frankiaceae bacterium]